MDQLDQQRLLRGLLAALLVWTVTMNAVFAGTTSDPVSGAPVNLNSAPGSVTVIQAEGFDKGGEGIAFHNPHAPQADCAGGVTPCWCQQSMRAGEGIGICGAAPAFTTYLDAGTWLQYTVWVAAAASYTVALNVAFYLSECAICKDAAYHVELDGAKVTDPIALGPLGTAGWGAFEWRGESAPFPISQGQHTLRVVIDKPWFNWDALRVRYAQDTTVIWNGYSWVPIMRVFPQ